MNTTSRRMGLAGAGILAAWGVLLLSHEPETGGGGAPEITAPRSLRTDDAGAAQTPPSAAAKSAAPVAAVQDQTELAAWSDPQRRSIRRQIADAEYQFTSASARNGRKEGYFAPNRAQAFQAHFDEDGFLLSSPDGGDGGWSFAMAGTPGGASPIERTRNILRYHQDDITTWYVNQSDGLEQGFTLEKRPHHLPPGEPLRIRLPFVTDLYAEPGADGNSVVFLDRAGRVRLRYESLFAYDAKGERLPARMGFEPGQGEILITVDDRGARYPLTIDPVLVTQLGMVNALTPAISNYYGATLAIDGDIMVMGTLAGEVTILERSPEGLDQWRPTTELTHPDGPHLPFGRSTSLQGGVLAVVGAGKVWLFERNRGGAQAWGLATTITPPHSASKVMMNRDRMAVATFSKTVHLYERNAGGPDAWGEIAVLDGDDYSSRASAFGEALALEGDTLVVGDPDDGLQNRGQAYVFHRDRGGPGQWGLVVTLTPPSGSVNDFEGYGSAVAVSRNERTVAVAAMDNVISAADGFPRVHVYDRDMGGANTWGLVRSVLAADTLDNQEFGRSVALDEEGDTLFVSDPMAKTPLFVRGAAYVFERHEGGSNNWGEALKLAATDGLRPAGTFGTALAYNRGVLVVGDPMATVDGLPLAGAAFVFRQGQREGTWSPLAHPTAPAPDPGERMGESVAMDGDFLVVGAPYAFTGSKTSGVAYVFRRHSDIPDEWSLLRTLNPGALLDGAEFGLTVDIDQDWIAVGAPGQTVTGVAGAGAVFLYHRNLGGADNWGLVGNRSADTPVEGGRFGYAVALDHDRLFAGAPTMGTGGRCYVLERNTGGMDAWGQVQMLTNPAASPGDRFGAAVACDEGRLLVGAPNAEGLSLLAAPLPNAGRAYVFQNAGAGYTLTQSLPRPGLAGSYGNAGALYGRAVAIQDDFALVGAPGETSLLTSHGAAYLHARNQDGLDEWGSEARFAPSLIRDGTEFGRAVALDLDRAYVGAPGFALNNAPTGAVAVFDRNKGGSAAWGQTDLLLPRDAQSGDGFGAALDARGRRLVVGRPGGDASGGDAGAVAIFQRWLPAWKLATQHQASDASAGDLFGAALALDGETLVVGAADPEVVAISAINSRNAAYVFKKNRNGEDAWGEVVKLLPLDSVANTSFGAAVDVSGDHVIVGAYRADLAGDDRGAAYVFSRNQGGLNQWGQVKKLVGTPAADQAFFGYSVSLDANWAAVGAPKAPNGALASSGYVTVFRRQEGGADNWGEVADVRPADPVDDMYFGFSIALDGDQLLVGAPLVSPSNLSSGEGRAYLFSRNQGGADTWGQVVRFVRQSPNLFDAQYGRCVALDGDTAAVAGGQSLTDGWVNLHERNAGGENAWGETAHLPNPTTNTWGRFGHALALSGDTLAIGSPGEDWIDNTYSGAVYIYLRTPSAAEDWVLRRTFLPVDSEPWGNFGVSVAVDARTLAVGADRRNDSPDLPGDVYLYTLEGDDYESWARGWFGDATVDNETLTSGTWGPNANPDNDPLPNLAEAYLGLDPLTANPSESLLDQAFGDTATGEVVLRWRRGREYHDILAEVEWSPDMVSWYPAGDAPPGLSPPLADIGTVETKTNFDRLEARISTDRLERAYFRLRLRKQ